MLILLLAVFYFSFDWKISQDLNSLNMAIEIWQKK